MLGVSRTASREVITKGYNHKKMLYHPDNIFDNLTQVEQKNMFKIIYRAYMLLAVPENEEFKTNMIDKEINKDGFRSSQCKAS